MWKSSGGNALFLHHLVEGALEAGTLQRVGGVWQLRGRTAITSELASLLEHRIERLPAPILHALQLLTVCEPIDVDVLSELADEETVEEAEADGLVRLDRDGDRLTVRFAHPLLGEVIRRRVGVASTRRLRGQLVGALQRRPLDGAADRIRLAELALDSDRPADLTLLEGAAADAALLANQPLGERFARAAVDRGGGLESAVLLARALMWQGHPAEAERILTAFDPTVFNQRQLVLWAATRFANLLFSMGDSERADEVLAQARERITRPALAGVVTGIGSVCAAFENRLDEALADAENVLARDDAPAWAVEWAAFGGMLALALMGRGGAVGPLAARLRAVEDQTDGTMRFPAGFGEILAMTLIGELDAARRRADDFVEYSSAGQYLAWAMANIVVGSVELARGRFVDAAARLEQSLAALISEAATSWSFPARIMLVQAYAGMGRTSDAARVLAEAKERFGRHVAVFGPQLRIAQARLSAAEGTVTLAVGLARRAGAEAAQGRQFGIEADALHAAARFGDQRVAARLAELAGELDGRLVAVHARHAAAVAASDGPALDAAAADYETIGALPSAADAAAQAALAHERAADRRRLVESAATANRLSAACGGTTTPALRAAAQPLPLTVREREIANLVSAGLSNKQIADRLTVSVRTVEGHLYHACTKLDVTDREALSALIQSAG